jgi:hypothetical protein
MLHPLTKRKLVHSKDMLQLVCCNSWQEYTYINHFDCQSWFFGCGFGRIQPKPLVHNQNDLLMYFLKMTYTKWLEWTSFLLVSSTWKCVLNFSVVDPIQGFSQWWHQQDFCLEALATFLIAFNTLYRITEYRDQHKVNGITFTPIPRYMRYFFFFFSFLAFNKHMTHILFPYC